MNRIYLLARYGDISYDETTGFVIAAKDEIQARKMANELAKDEGKIWVSKRKVSCVEIIKKGDPRIILQSFNAG